MKEEKDMQTQELATGKLPSIKELRIAKNMSQQELSELAHVSLPVVSRAENDKPIQPDSALSICNALGVSIESVHVVLRTRRLK